MGNRKNSLKASRGLFVTATDTASGKTEVCALLIKILEKRGISVRVSKPVESRSPADPGDASRLAAACLTPPRREKVCAYSFTIPVSPAIAAQITNTELLMADVFAFCRTCDSGNFLLVEGAGGLYSPLTRDGLNADLAQLLGYPILILAANKLGCVNHALLTIECAKRRNLRVLALVLNEIQPASGEPMNNVDELRRLCGEKVVSLKYNVSCQENVATLSALTQEIIPDNKP